MKYFYLFFVLYYLGMVFKTAFFGYIPGMLESMFLYFICSIGFLGFYLRERNEELQKEIEILKEKRKQL